MAKKEKKLQENSQAELQDLTTKEKFKNTDDNFFIGKQEETTESKERISKRRAKVFSLLKKFNNETTQVKEQLSKINADLIINQTALNKNLNELQRIDAELNRRKEQLEAFAEISETYIEFVCEKFDVEKDQIIKIKESKN